MNRESVIKTYVTVVLKVKPDGKKIPKEVIWKDGRRFLITKVLSSRRAASTKAGGTGMRYEIVVNGQQTKIWEEEGRWFVEEYQMKSA